MLVLVKPLEKPLNYSDKAMAENPFDSFFTGLIGGATAGARRRTLIERGQQGAGMAEEFFGGGPVTPPKAPGMGATFLAGLQLARTLPTTPSQQLQADQLKLQIANQALDQQIFEAKQQAAEAEKIALKTKAKAEAEAERDNSMLFADLTSRAETAIAAGNFDQIAGIRSEAKGLPVSQQVQLNTIISDLNDTYDSQEFIQFGKNKEYLAGFLPPQELNSITPPEAKRLVDVYFGKPISSIGAMVSDYESYNARGSTNAAQFVLGSIRKNTETTGQRIELDPTTGQFTISEEIISGPKADISKTEEAERAEGLESSEILFSTIDQARSLVQQNPNLVGSTGQIAGGLNALKEIVRPFVDLPQNATRIQVENAFNTLRVQALTSLGGGSLARLTDKDAKILENTIPQLKLTSSPAQVMQVLDQLDGTISLRYLLNRSRTNTLGTMLEELGASKVGKLAATAGRLNFRPGLVDEVIREAINSIDSQTDQALARQQTLDLFTALRDYGFSDAQREPYIQYADTLSTIE
jgi:hypothetical protein